MEEPDEVDYEDRALRVGNGIVQSSPRSVEGAVLSWFSSAERVQHPLYEPVTVDTVPVRGSMM